MPSAVYLGGNLVGIPEERKPSMHALFYRIEARGEINMTTKGDMYRVSLKMPQKKYPLVVLNKDFYCCLYSLYRELERKEKHIKKGSK